MSNLALGDSEARRIPGETLRKALLSCGTISSLYYAFMNVYVPARWKGYSMTSQVVSELSAIGAPTRALWNQLGIVYTSLIIAFGVGIWMSAGRSRALRAAGALFVADGVIGAYWPPMTMRGMEPTLTDTLHIVWTAFWFVVMLSAMGFAVAALGTRFRVYSFVTLVVFLVFGTLTSLEAPGIATNAPTPWIGVWERINIGVAMLWIAVLAVALLRRPVSAAGASAAPRSAP